MKKGTFFKGLLVLLLLAVVMILGSCEDATGSTITYSVPDKYKTYLVGETYSTSAGTASYTFTSSALLFDEDGDGAVDYKYAFISNMVEGTDSYGYTTYTVTCKNTSTESESTKTITVSSTSATYDTVEIDSVSYFR